MTCPPEVVAEVKARVGLAELIGGRVALKKRGRERVGLCPFHSEKTPSFTVSENKGFFHCFGCGVHGDAIDFAMRSSNVNFAEAVEQLAQQVGLEVPASEAGDAAATRVPVVSTATPMKADLDAEREQKRRAARSKCAEAGPATGTVVESYLRATRGIPLGLVPPAIRFHAALYHSREHGSMPAMLAAATRDGAICAIQATYLDVGALTDAPVKTTAAPPRKTFGTVTGSAVRFGRLGERLILAEGIEDALSIFAVTGATTWATLGAGNFATVQIPPMVSEIVLAIDADDAGRRAAAKAAARFEREGVTCLIAEPPGAKDFNEILKQ